jgi:uncharacterized protein YndB with AHSA1/START domain
MKTILMSVLLCTGCSCTTVRQLRDPSTLKVDGHAERTRSDSALDYSVAIHIDAPPEAVWGLLTDVKGYPQWNSTIVSLDGSIAKDGSLKLVSKEKPDKTFDLKVSAFDAPKKMVWEDGGAMFLGVRNFTLTPAEGGTTFAMSETFSGGMLGMIEGSLPDFTKGFETFAADLKKRAEAQPKPN